MNPRIIKEIRVLLPAFGLVLAAAAMPMFIGPNRHELAEIWMGLLFGLGCLVMGAEAFGTEFHQKTLPLLLTQPIARTSIWKEKMQILGMALGIGTVILGVAILLFDRQLVSGADFPWVGCVLFPTLIFCTVPYWTLLFRTTLAGVVFAVVAPGLMLGVNSSLHQKWIENGKSVFGNWFQANGRLHHLWIKDPSAEESSVITLLILYCAVLCWLGYRKFKKLQVVDAYSMTASRELGLPPRFEALLLRPFRALSSGFTGHFATLLKKELRLQQFTFLAAAVFSLMAITGAFLQQWQSAADQGKDWASLLLACTFFFYLPVLPLIAGAVAVAEEKAWGVADWHLALPPSALKQWAVKIIAALGTSFALGLLLPAALGLAGAAYFGEFHAGSPPRFHALRVALSPNGAPEASMSAVTVILFCVLLGHALLTSVAIYAGSIAASTARALVLALGMLFATGCLLWLGGGIAFAYLEPPDMESRINLALRRGADLHQIQMAFFTVLASEMFLVFGLLHCCAFRCHRARGMTRRELGFQAPLFVLILVCFSIAFVWLHYSGVLWR